MEDHIHILLCRTSIATVCFLFLTTCPQYSHSQQHDNKSQVCSQPFKCGLMSNLSYPFWDEKRPRYCGGRDQFKLINCDTLPSIQFDSQNFQVLDINTKGNTMKLVRTQTDNILIAYDECSEPEASTNNSLSSTLFRYTQSVYNISIFYNCPHGFSYPVQNFTCSNDPNQYAFYVEDTQLPQFPDTQNCKYHTQVQALHSFPLDHGGGIDALKSALYRGFEVNYTTEDAQQCKTCLASYGICGRNDIDMYQFSCHCPDESDASECSDKSTGQEIHEFQVCSRPFNCGSLSNLNYPFWDEKGPRYCGGSDQFKLINCDTFPSIQFDSQNFQVLDINTKASTMKLVRIQADNVLYEYDDCSEPEASTNNSLSSTFFRYTQSVYNISIFYNCPHGFSYPVQNFTCLNAQSRYAFYVEDTQLPQFPDTQKCADHIQVQALQGIPLDHGGGIGALNYALGGGFEVNYTIEDAQQCKTCRASNGICGRNDIDMYQFSCHCPDGSDASDCSDNSSMLPFLFVFSSISYFIYIYMHQFLVLN